jgi:hypothetical protein
MSANQAVEYGIVDEILPGSRGFIASDALPSGMLNGAVKLPKIPPLGE